MRAAHQHTSKHAKRVTGSGILWRTQKLYRIKHIMTVLIEHQRMYTERNLCKAITHAEHHTDHTLHLAGCLLLGGGR